MRINAYIIGTFFDNDVIYELAKSNCFNHSIFSVINLRLYLHMYLFTFEKSLNQDLCYQYNIYVQDKMSSVLSGHQHYNTIPNELYKRIAVSGPILFPRVILKRFL